MTNEGVQPFFSGQPVGQVGVVVRDLDEALRRYTELWSGSRWVCYTYGPALLRTQTLQGEPGTFIMRIALSSQTPQVELIEPVRGPSIYHDWLETCGEGVHHLGFFVPSVEATIADMERLGYPTIQSGIGTGVDGDGGFAYFDLRPLLGVVVEAIERPRRRRVPEAVWGAAAEGEAGTRVRTGTGGGSATP